MGLTFLEMKRLLYITLTLIDLAICWKPYSDPLVIPTPISNANGTTAITIELLIEWRLSMASQDKLTHITMIDYFPNEQKWYRRSSDQLTACDDRSLLSNNDDLLNNLVQLHGLHQRIITVNGQSPAKPIVVPLGAEVLLRVTNKLLTESISIHIHGLDKRGLWYTDGVPYLQQCPIVVNSKYTYRFIADTPGTHWLHGHMMTDRGEGLLGAFVVTDTDRSAVIDMNGNRIVPTREYVAMLQDWTLPTASDSLYQSRWQSKKWLYGHDNVSECFSAPRSYDGTMIGGAMPLSALLINDKGWYDQQMILSEPWKLPLETFQIRLNEKILLRLINGGVAQQFIFSIEDHSLIVVAADGSSIKPITVDMLAIFPGERYDVLVEGKSHTNRTTYYIILETLEYYTNDFLHRKPFYGLGKMQYDEQLNETGESPADFKHQKCTATSVCTILNCPFATFPPDIFYKCVNVAELRSLNVAANDADILSDRQESNSAFEEHFINMHHGSYVNGWRFISPSGMPYYHNSDENAVTQWCDASKCPSTDVSPFDPGCQCFFHLNITYGNIVQLTFYNMGEAKSLPGCTHAFHIHGTHFYLMKMGFGSYNSSSGMLMTNNADLPCGNGTICNNLQWTNTSWSHGRVPAMNTIDPSFRDTVIIPAGGYVVLRFRATNPGWYYGHCHIMMHQLDGMAFAMRIGTHAEMPAPPDNFPYGCELFEPPPLNMTEISTTSSMLTTTISTKSSAATIHRIYVSILCISSSLFCPQIVNVPSTVVNVQ